jgi:hypothetical protein
MTTMVKKVASILRFIGVDPGRLVALTNLPKYISQSRSFRRLGGKITHRFPILSDYDDQAGSASGHYFHQDLLVASFVYLADPARHIDVGSRIDGFVAHVASFRRIEVMDVRDLDSTGHENISFLKANLMERDHAKDGICDSVSCLNAIEHFGLGRYGDPIDPVGHLKGFNNILRMLKVGGTFYISFPIGRGNEVHFNAHRVFHPADVLSWPDGDSAVQLERFDYVDDRGGLHRNVAIADAPLDVTFGCGIYTFRKLS